MKHRDARHAKGAQPGGHLRPHDRLVGVDAGDQERDGHRFPFAVR